MTMNIFYWASIASPIVGVIAIIVSLEISRKASKDANSQIKAIYDLLDVFVAAQNPNMMKVKQQYEEQLKQLEVQISLAKEDMVFNCDSLLGHGGTRIDVIEAIEDAKERKRKHEELLLKQEEVKNCIQLIQNYLDKVRSKN